MELEERADRMINLVSESVAYSIWNVDIIGLNEQLEWLASDPEIAQFTITAIGYGKVFEITTPLELPVDPIIRFRDINFTDNETGSQKIGEVRIVLTRSLVEKDIIKARKFISIFVIVFLLILYSITFLFLRHMVSGPVNRLQVMVDKIAFGELQIRCPIESSDELGRLAIRFNTMADRLEESTLDLHDKENRLQFVLEGSQLGYWDWDIPSGVVIRDARWANMLGYTLEELNLTVDDWSDLLHPDDKEMAWKSINDHLEGRTKAHDIEYRMKTKDGKFRWILDQAKLVSWDEHGRPLRMCGTQKDITERKLAEKEREKLQNRLIQSQKMESVGQLAGGVAHDFNNMLSVILGYTELAIDQTDQTAPLYQNLQEIYNAGKRSADITRQLLAFARKQTVVPKILDLNTSVEGMLKMLERLIGEDISLVWIPKSERNLIKIDPSQLDQLLVNFCVNARDAISGGGKIIIETGNVAFGEKYCHEHPEFLQGDYVYLTVSDDGSGMDEEVLQKIFEPFFTTKELGRGTGLGMATVYGIIKQNDGFINVYSELGLGTSFNVYFPIQLNDSDYTEQKKILETNTCGTETILIVEDDIMVLKLAKVMLERLGYHVLIANTPTEALELVETNSTNIHLTLTDVVMSEMTGRELANRIETLCPESKILFMSGYTADVIAHRGLLDDSVCFIHKPLTIKELSIKVREALEQS